MRSEDPCSDELITVVVAFEPSATSDRVRRSPFCDETVTLTYRRTGRMEDAIEVGRRIRGEGYPDAIELLHSSPRLFEDAIATYERYTEHGFSFTDAMTVALVERHGIDSVLSFDDEFDGVVDRLVPETVASAQ